MFVEISYHTESERVDVIDVFKAILPGHETLDVDVELIPDAHDGLIVLLIPTGKPKPPIVLEVQLIWFKVLGGKKKHDHN